MKHIYIFLAVLFLGCIATEAFAGDENSSGTSGAQELRIPIGARSTAMGGGMVSDAKGAEAMFWNPAGIVFTDRFEAGFSYLDYFAGMKHTFVGVVSSLGSLGHIGVNARVFSIGEIEVTREDVGGKTGEVITPAFMTVGMTYARQMTDRVIIGMSASYISEQISRESAKGVAFDFGFQYHVGLGGLKLGAVIKNIGPNMTFDGADLDSRLVLPQDDPTAASKNVRLSLTSFELPSYMQVGVSYDVDISMSQKATFIGAFRNNNFMQDEYMGGIEYGIGNMIFLRGGYMYSNQDHYIMGATYGFGLNLNMGGTQMMLDYAMAQTDFFDNNQWFTLSFKF